MATEPVLGIHLDFANNNVVVSALNGNSVNVVLDPKGNYSVPFYVAFTETCVLIGEEAQEYKSQDSENCIYDIGKFIGHTYTDEELLKINKKYRFKLTNEEGVLKMSIKFLSVVKSFPVSYILAMFFNKLVKTTLGYARIGKIHGLVLTVPDNYNKNVWDEIKAALRYTQYKLIEVIPESHAIKIAYGLTSHSEVGQKVIVCNFTERQCTVHIYYQHGKFSIPVETHMRENVVQFCVDHFEQEFGCDITKDAFLLKKVKEESLKAINELTTSDEYVIKVDNTLLQVRITREQFDALNEDNLINDLKDILNELQDVAVDDEVTHILFAGRYSLIPRIRKLFLEAYEERQLFLAAAPDLVVSYGAATCITTGKNPFQTIQPVTQMKFSAQLSDSVASPKIVSEPVTAPVDEEMESIVVIQPVEVSNEVPKVAPKHDENEMRSRALNELSNNMQKFKTQIDEVSSYLLDETKQIADDHFTYLTKWMLDCKAVADVHVIDRQQKHLESIIEPLIHSGKLAKESYEVLETLVNEEYVNKHYTNALKHCNKIISLKHLNDDEKEKWEKFRSKILYEQQEFEKGLIDEEEPDFVSIKEVPPGHDRESFISDVLKAADDENYNKAIEICNEALLHFPSDEEILYFRAHSLKELRKHTEAIHDFTQVIQQNQTNSNAVMHRGECYYNCKMYKEALEDFKNCTRGGKKTKSLEILIEKTKFQIELSKIDDLIDQRNYNKAGNIMIALEEKHPEVLEDELKAEFLMRRAEILFYMDKTYDAMKDIERVLNNYPELKLAALKLRVKCHESREELDAAIEDLKAIHEMEPNEENQLKLQRMKKRQGLMKKQEYFKSQYNVKSL